MKRLIAVGIVLAAAGLVPAQESAGKPLSLGEAIQLALTNNREVLASKDAVESARHGVRSSYGKFLPQIGVEAKYTKLNNDIDLDLNEVRTALISADVATLQATGVTNPLILNAFRNNLEARLPSFVSRVQKDQYYNFNAGLLQPVFTGGKLIANTKAKQEEYRVSLSRDLLTRNKVVADVVTSYCRVQLMKDLVAIRREVADGIAEHATNADKLFREGVISKANKMRADVALADAQREYSKALKDQELSLLLLDNALGVPAGNAALSTPLFQTGSLKGREQYVTSAMNSNPNLATLLHRRQQLRQKYNATRAEFLPSIALFGRYEIYKEDLTVLEPEWAAGVVARLNIFNGGSDYNDIKSVENDLAALDKLTEHARQLITTEISKDYLDLESAKEQYDSLNKSVELAEENLRLNRLSFNEGMAPSLDVIDAQLALGKVKTEQSKALFDYDTALVALLSASGNAMDILNYNK